MKGNVSERDLSSMAAQFHAVMLAAIAAFSTSGCLSGTPRDDLKSQLEECRRQHQSDLSRRETGAPVGSASEAQRFANEQRRRRAAMQRAMDTFSKGVCLIHGGFTLKETRDGRRVPVEGKDGTPFEIEYFGSGFLVDARGLILTNRHVAEPWWNDDAVAPLLARGLTPEFTILTATFPGHAPAEVDPSTIRTSRDGVDLAVFVVSVDSVPVLPLRQDHVRELTGQGIMLLGYPTGLGAILARAEPDVVEDALSAAKDTEGLIRELSVRDAIRPLPTHGTLNEVTDSKLVYDAVTTSGGSGGPVFGPDGSVIGVNFAMLRGFQGSNFGIPIRLARPLLGKAEEMIINQPTQNGDPKRSAQEHR